VRPFDLRDAASVQEVAEGGFEAVVHLAAVASGADARRDPGAAWEINAAGTARLCEALSDSSARPLLLLASTAEVYGSGEGPRLRVESDPTVPCSPYAASKLGAEIAAAEVGRRTGLRVIVRGSRIPGRQDVVCRRLCPADPRRPARRTSGCQ
jgi:UDP-glucose 4-epimerase